jgi:hypothetical protein
MKIKITINIFFEDPFYVGIFERIIDGSLEVAKVIFGSEPSDQEVYNLIIKDSRKIKFSKPLEIDLRSDKKVNPKCLKHKIQKEIRQPEISTKSQQALKSQMESIKKNSKDLKRKNKLMLEDYKYQKKLEKKKLKHKGR